MKKTSALLCALALLLGLTSCSESAASPDASAAGGPLVRAGVLYNGDWRDQSWEDCLSQLEQPLLLGLSVEAVDVSKPFSLDGFDVLYPDMGIRYREDAEDIFAQIVSWVDGGGSVLVPNDLYDCFDRDFIGAKEFVRVYGYPEDLEFPALGADLTELQEIIRDFSALYPGYQDFRQLSRLGYGYAALPSTATALVTQGKLALYTMNDYGGGHVFFTNPLLPNAYSINGFSLTRRTMAQRTAANTTIGANQLLRNAFASYVSKQLHGYSAYRVFGSFGSPAMSWELHYEDITAFQYNAAEIFGELCKEYQQIPSYSIIRSPYRWFLRTESVTYLLGSPGQSLSFLPDKYENVYSSGSHVAVGSEWLSLSSVEHGGSYFADYPQFGQRACPYPCDWNGDGLYDLIVGGEDGSFYFFAGEGFTDRLHVSSPELLTLENGTPLSVGSYSAPVAADMDGDGIADLLSGSGDGGVYLFRGTQDGAFASSRRVLDLDAACQTFPDLCDLDGDGLEDLLVGTNDGRLLLYPGTGTGRFPFDLDAPTDLSALCGPLGTWLAPRGADVDRDGTPEILVGTFDGYVAILKRVGHYYVREGYLSSSIYNYKGNTNVKFGNNCIPSLLDLNGDGVLDLLAGSLEYGLSYPIDSEYFPFRTQLQEQIDYMMDNRFYLSPHLLTGDYVSDQWEQYELSAHLRALRSYGAQMEYMGTNQHTWRTAQWDQKQTFENIWNAGLLWDSGFKFPGSSADPQSSEENVLSLPFFLEMDGERTLLLQNCSTLLYADASWPDLSAKYGVPMCVYYHCDFAYESEENARNTIERSAAFQQKHGYSFVREDQLMLGSAAAYRLELEPVPTAEGVGVPFDLTLTPSSPEDGHPLSDDRYSGSCGIKLCLGEKLSRRRFATDASVWRWADRSTLYLSADRPVRVYEVKEAQTAAHLSRVNLPADIELTRDGAALTFLDDGMMQAVVDGRASTTSTGWRVQHLEDGSTQFTKFGDADTLELIFYE